jgi:rRNA maturation endonuclease Nob1
MAKIRAIVNGVSFYTTSTAIKKQTSGDFSMQNVALSFALDCMGKSAGFGRNITLYDEKMQRHSFDIQLSVL